MINLFQPPYDENSIKAVDEVLKSKWLGRGQQTVRFEEEFAQFLDCDVQSIHTLSCCSDAIYLAPLIFELEKGSEVVIPTNSFPVVGSTLLLHGLKPKIVDIDAQTGNISLEALESSVSKNTSAVFITDYGGTPVDVDAVRSIVGRNIFIFHDVAGSLGSVYGGKMTGLSADFACWSFDAMKLLCAGEGGAFFVADAKRMRRAKELSYLGLPANKKSGLDSSKTADRWWEYEIVVPGIRSIFPNINAALGLIELPKIESYLTRKKEIANAYIDVIDSLDKIEPLTREVMKPSHCAYFFTIVSRNRDALASHLKDNGVYCSLRYSPLHRMSLFAEFSSDCAGAEDFFDIALNIPIHQTMTTKEITAVTAALKKAESI